MHIIPSLLPDELLDGYRGRLAALNAIGSRQQVTKFISRIKPDGLLADPSDRYFLDSIAIANNKNVSEIVMEHTLWPLMAAIDRATTTNDIESMARRPRTVSAFSRKGREELWLCHNCVKEDIKTRNFAYWRCSHQVPGRHSCQAHGTRLRFVGMQSLMLDFPDEALHRAQNIDEDLFVEIRRNRLVSQFDDFMNVVFKEKITFEFTHCLSKLKSTVFPTGKDMNKKLQRQYFMSRLENTLSAPWLSWVMPDVSPGRGHQAHFFRNWFTSSTLPFSITSMAIIASVIFPSADEAIHALRKS